MWATPNTRSNPFTKAISSAMSKLTLLVPTAALLCSCSSPPKPTEVDFSKRRPVNTTVRVALQACQSELQNTKLEASIARTTEVAGEPAPHHSAATAPVASPNQAHRLYVILFSFGSSVPSLSAAASQQLAISASEAALVLVRGRTDGNTETQAESRIARSRAEAVRDLLVAAGVPSERIRMTYQPVGDFTADNTTPFGRARNRRVEIELYADSPDAVVLNASS